MESFHEVVSLSGSQYLNYFDDIFSGLSGARVHLHRSCVGILRFDSCIDYPRALVFGCWRGKIGFRQLLLNPKQHRLHLERNMTK